MDKHIHIAAPTLGTEEYEALLRPIESGWLTQGPEVAAFEKEFALAHNANHGLATTSATTALHLGLLSLGVKSGDEVIVPAFTWVATANVVLYCGATPIFVDIDPITYNIDVNQVQAAITPNTKAIIPVHLFGYPADIDQLKEILPDSVKILEDAACGAGAKYKDRFVGTLGDAGAFSFHPRKSITTGEGGMLTTNQKSVFELSQMLRNHGASISEEKRHLSGQPHLMPDFNVLGFNYRMTDMQGAVGRVQLTKLERFIEDRAKWAKWYRQELAEISWLRLPKEPVEGRHSWQAFVCYVDPTTAPLPRNEIMDILQENNISTRPGTHAVHMLDYYKNRYNLKDDDFPIANLCDKQTMALPLHNKMSADNFEHIVSVIKSI